MAAVADFFSLGSIVWCRTCYNAEVEGEVLAFEPQTKMLILKCNSSNGDPKLNDVHFLNLSLVSELQVKKEGGCYPELPASINLQRMPLCVVRWDVSRLAYQDQLPEQKNNMSQSSAVTDELPGLFKKTL